MSPISPVVSGAPQKTKITPQKPSLSPSSPATHPNGSLKPSAPDIVFQGTDKNSAYAFIRGYERGASTPANGVTKGMPIKGTAPLTRGEKMEKSPQNLAKDFGLWLEFLNRNCLTEKTTVYISKDQITDFLKFQNNSIRKKNKWDQSVSNFLLRIQPLVTANSNTIDCTQLLPLIDDFLKTTRKNQP